LNKGAETVEQKNPIANPLIVLREEFDDWAMLPDVLSPFYYLFRPLHMAGRHSGQIFRAMARK
jgi:hypothetical protein